MIRRLACRHGDTALSEFDGHKWWSCEDCGLSRVLTKDDRCFMCGHTLTPRRWWQPRLRRCRDRYDCFERFQPKFGAGAWFA